MAQRSLGLSPVLPGARLGFPWRAVLGHGLAPWLLAPAVTIAISLLSVQLLGGNPQVSLPERRKWL